MSATTTAGIQKTDCASCKAKGCRGCGLRGYHTHLSSIDGRTATRRFEVERWSTIGVDQAEEGDVINLPGPQVPRRPVVVLGIEDRTGRTPNDHSEKTLTCRYIDTGEQVSRHVWVRVSLLHRNDLHYPAAQD